MSLFSTYGAIYWGGLAPLINKTQTTDNAAPLFPHFSLSHIDVFWYFQSTPFIICLLNILYIMVYHPSDTDTSTHTQASINPTSCGGQLVVVLTYIQHTQHTHNTHTLQTIIDEKTRPGPHQEEDLLFWPLFLPTDQQATQPCM